MRNINLRKFGNVLSVFLTVLMIALPLAAAAQGGFRPVVNPADPVGGVNTASQIIIRIIEILLAIAGLIAVIFLIVGGFRYITAGGNEEASESAKKTITNAIIGIVIIILAFVIVRVISNALIGGSTQV